MSTRSVITIFQDSKAVRLYQHCDGYPSATLELINDHFESTLELMAGRLEAIGRAPGSYGGPRVEWSGNADAAPVDLFSDQGDVEWIYKIDLDSGVISIYGGGYFGRPAFELVERGPINPMGEIERMRDEYKQATGARILEAMSRLARQGVKIERPRSKGAA